VRVAWTHNEYPDSNGQNQVVALATFDSTFGPNCAGTRYLEEGLALLWSNDGGNNWPSSNVINLAETFGGGVSYRYTAADLTVMPFTDPVRNDGTHNFYIYANYWASGAYHANLFEYYISTGGGAAQSTDYPNAAQAGPPLTGSFPGNPDTVKIVGGHDTNGRDFLWSAWSDQAAPGGCATGTVNWYASAVGNGGSSWGPPYSLDSDAGFKECVNSQNQLNWTEPSLLFDSQDHSLSFAYSKKATHGLRAKILKTGPINWSQGPAQPVFQGPDPCTPGPAGCTVRTDETDQILPVLAMSGAGFAQHAAIVYFDNRDDPSKSKLYGDVYGMTSSSDSTANFPPQAPGSDTNVVPFQSVSSQSTTNLRNIALTGFTQGPQFFGSVPGTTLLTNFSFTP
jgi:hypothetical protein